MRLVPGGLVAGREVLKVTAQRAGAPGGQRRRVVRRPGCSPLRCPGSARRRVAPPGCPGAACPAALSPSARARCSSASACSARASSPARASSAAAIRASKAARSSAWSRAASSRTWITCRSAAWRPRSSSARADWAASRARAASCPAVLARDSAAATRSSAARRAWAIWPCGLGLLLGGSPRRHRPGQQRIGLQRRSTRLSGLRLGPRAAPPEREPRAARIQRPGRTATVPGQQLPLPERRQRRMRLPGHRVRQPAVPWLRPCLPRPRLILTARIRASEDTLSGLDHRQAPFSADQHSVTGRPPRAAGTSASRHGTDCCRAKPSLPVPALACHGQDAGQSPHIQRAGSPRRRDRHSAPPGQPGIVPVAFSAGAGQRLAAGARPARGAG